MVDMQILSQNRNPPNIPCTYLVQKCNKIHVTLDPESRRQPSKTNTTCDPAPSGNALRSLQRLSLKTNKELQLANLSTQAFERDPSLNKFYHNQKTVQVCGTSISGCGTMPSADHHQILQFLHFTAWITLPKNNAPGSMTVPH